MKRLLTIACGTVLACCLFAGVLLAQSGGGTVNTVSDDPQQNQKLSGDMGTTTGQPNSVTPGSRNNPNGGNPGGEDLASPYEQSQQQSRDAQYRSAQPAGSPGENSGQEKKKGNKQVNPADTESGNAPNQTQPHS